MEGLPGQERGPRPGEGSQARRGDPGQRVRNRSETLESLMASQLAHSTETEVAGRLLTGQPSSQQHRDFSLPAVIP